MLTTRLRGRAILRALVLTSAIAVVSGVALAARAEAPTQTAAAASADYRSDRLSVQVTGSGPDVVLIPGLGSSRDVWSDLARRLSATHRVHLVQLAGFAGEPWAHGDGPFVAPAVEALSDYLTSARVERPAVIGHSMGALTGLLLAQSHPDQVGRLLSVDSLPFFPVLFGPAMTVERVKPQADAMTAALVAMDAAAFRSAQTASVAGFSRSPDMQAKMVEWTVASDRRAFAAAMRDVMTTDARPGLAAMTTPVTALYASDANGGTPAAMADAMWTGQYAALPNVRLVRVDDSRHFIMADQPERFAALVDDFLK